MNPSILFILSNVWLSRRRDGLCEESRGLFRVLFGHAKLRIHNKTIAAHVPTYSVRVLNSVIRLLEVLGRVVRLL